MKIPRRLVTGTDVNGRSVLISDGPVPSVGADRGQVVAWAASQVPAAVMKPEDVDSSERLVDPPTSGAKVFFVEMPPDDPSIPDADKRAFAKAVFGSFTGFEQPDASRHPFMHRTWTIDCVILLSGELSLLLDEGEEIRLRPFDVVVQQATNHAWVNRGSGPALFAAIMMAAKGRPAETGSSQ